MARERKKVPAGATGSPAPATVSRPELLIDGSDAAFRDLMHDLMAFAHHIETCRDGFGALVGLTGVQYEILMAAKRGAGSMGVSQLADRLHRSGAFITLEVNKLVGKGVLEKADDPQDGRRVLLRVTPEGDALVRTLAPYQRQVNDALFACLDRRRFDALRRLASELTGCGDRAVALIDYLARGDEPRVA